MSYVLGMKMADKEKKVLKTSYSVYNERCPSRNVLVGISDKWSILIINLLFHKVYRFGELKREIGGISPKMLSQSLNKLERYGFVARQSFPVLPMKVEYTLTPLGKNLGVVISSLTSWTVANMEKINQVEIDYLNKTKENKTY